MQEPNEKVGENPVVVCRFCFSTEDVKLQKILVKDLSKRAASESGGHAFVCIFCRKRLAHETFEFFGELHENNCDCDN